MNTTVRSFLRCMNCKAEVQLYGTTQFVCPCGGLYDVCHTGVVYEKSLLQEFDRRAVPSHSSPLMGSGVWRFKEFIMPSLSDTDIVSLGEGILPMWQAGNNLRRWVGGELDLWIMPQGLGPTGSFKDFGGTVAVSVAKKSGVRAVACASTGDTSAMAAAYAAKAGMNCFVVLPKGQLTDAQLSQPIAHGARVILIPGDFDDCLRVIKELMIAGKVFPINSINPTRIEGHQATVFSTAQFFGWRMPDVFVLPLGNGSNTSSVGKGIRLLQDTGLVLDAPKIIAAQSSAANPLARSWEVASEGGYVANSAIWRSCYRAFAGSELGVTTATASRIGDPVSFLKVMREIHRSRGAVLTANESELNHAVMVAGADGHLVCPQTGTAIAGLKQAVERGFVKRGQRVVIVSTATGLKFPHVPVQFSWIQPMEISTCKVDDVAIAMGV